ncbi:hypothetical protein Deipe_4263 (plasmid) [Deinococcus peraridilitoris DSM 19664]|uniref:Uncharacterized protein n=2 Tax=Deinococcus TaxID=1298 RepID=L0A916_DEIPD|nr:hypothetical protein Deipe_4263 [Deinococcus peraridilitoris DSM 19664]
MTPDDLNRWVDFLTKEQKEKLRWLQNHRCMLEASWAPKDTLQDLSEGVVLEVKIDRHGVVKARGTDISEMFDYVFNSAKSLFEYVEKHDPEWKGSNDRQS